MVAFLVTRQQMITFIRDAVRKTKYRCPHPSLQKDFDLVASEYHSKMCKDCGTIINLDPWTVTLSHVLLTLQKIAVMPDDYLVLSNGRIVKDGMKKNPKWNLEKDSLDEQEDACITTLYLWLKMQ